MTQSTSLPPALREADVKRSLSLSIVEGALYAVMVGLGEAYFIADGVRLGASPMLLGLLVGLPLAIGGVAAAAGLRLMRWVSRRRPLLTGLVVLQAMVLLGLALLEHFGQSSAILLLVAICAYQACGQLAGALWSSWYGDLVPVEVRGRYFARRSRVVQVVTFVALVIGGLWLFHGDPHAGGGVGSSGEAFFGLFLAAGIARLISAVLLSISPEPSFQSHERPVRVFQHLRSPAGRRAGRILSLVALLQFVVYVGSPYFSPFMLENLRLDYRSYMLATAAQVAAKVLSLRPFGAAVDNYGAASVYRLAVLLIALIPLPWLFVEGLGGVLLVQAFSGFAWAAHEVGLLGLLLTHSDPRDRPAVFAAQSLLNGHGQLLGSAFGGGLLHQMNGSFHAVFAATAIGRLAVAVALPFLTRDLRDPAGLGRSRLLLRVIGFRPSGGLVHRGVLEPEEVPIEEEAAP